MADFPDYHFPIILKGQYGTELKILSVDEAGRLIAALKAMYGVTAKDVQCDVNGNITLNLKAQDLSEIINRPKYGSAQRLSGTVSCPANTTTSLGGVSGRGVIYGGYIDIDEAFTERNGVFLIVIDGVIISGGSFHSQDRFSRDKEHVNVGYKLHYDDVNHLYCMGIMPGITFESQIEFRYAESNGNVPDVTLKAIYALI